ncbi:potassium channel family protein [Mycobacterium sp. 1081908.1]|uniref:potassium channel family protein n=1 Tax=Mycobacterium sp. 1081908.1 TaxID=1834066 RepID=UPI0007FF0102|nr:potassium channel family protein [Mycobacterium sp. 1081908.1]OBK46860.1 ion transporter [Mycobacterium sp. 1081908.1]
MSSRSTLERWERRTEWPLAGIAVVFLVTFSVKVLVNPGGLPMFALNVILWALWAGFSVDYFIRLTLAPQRGRWFVRHILDFVIVAVPFLRPLRLLRLVVIVAALQKAFGDAVRGRIVVYTATTAVLLVYAASLAVLQAERSEPSAHIRNFGDAVWWSITTITTVGYGDFYPVTTQGRLVAVMLMIGGMSLIGMITATVASWIVHRVADEDTTKQAATAAQIDELRSQIAQLTKLLTDTSPEPVAAGSQRAATKR